MTDEERLKELETQWKENLNTKDKAGCNSKLNQEIVEIRARLKTVKQSYYYLDNMKNITEVVSEVLFCERCYYEWPERRPLKRDKDDLKIVEVLRITPKFCPACKSPSWNIPRNA